jgi:ABC-2 type transport system permease protein
MDTAALETSDAAALRPGSHYSFVGVLRSEWTKLYSLRSTTWSLLATALLTIAIGILTCAVAAARWNQFGLIERLAFDPVRHSLAGVLFSQLAIGVLGVLVMSGEYGTGTIRSSLAAVPNRPLVLAAKIIVFSGVTVVVSEALSFTAFFVGQAVLSGTTPTATLGDPGVVGAVVTTGLYLTLLGLFALGLATIIRHTAGAISAFVGLLLILPLILQALPQSVIDAVAKYLPANIGVSVTGTHPPGEFPTFTPWVGIGLLALYTAITLLVGTWVLVRRDA